jgi:hypothetical protein
MARFVPIMRITASYRIVAIPLQEHSLPPTKKANAVNVALPLGFTL